MAICHQDTDICIRESVCRSLCVGVIFGYFWAENTRQIMRHQPPEDICLACRRLLGNGVGQICCNPAQRTKGFYIKCPWTFRI